ncbi:hypothetical protein KFE25_006502 [Diacronema lutheri]|uniref:Major facilitator superfamily (MFS) profile domain-containing protein n=2 Tax=Diacronema lutheri TaxID=2081491 RepID=A0A8J6CCM3_DIALT|nr:hypothetical protein KFE25_006502 [Diacronema lutheri]
MLSGYARHVRALALLVAVRAASATIVAAPTLIRLAQRPRDDATDALGVTETADAQARLNQQCVKLSLVAFFVAVGVCSPMLPDHYVRLGSTASRYGQGVAAYSAAQLVGGITMGAASDWLGHRPVLVVASLGTAASLLMCTAVRSPTNLVAVRAVSGLFAGIVAVARGAVGAGVAERERPLRIAELSAAGSLGLTLGPLLVALLGSNGRIGLVFGIAAALNLLSAAASARLMRPVDSARAASEARDGAACARQARGARTARDGAACARPARAGRRIVAQQRGDRFSQPLAQLMACAFTCSFAFTAGFSTYPLLAQRRYGFGAAQLGVLYAAVSATNAFALPHISRNAVARLGARGTARAAQALLGVAIAAVPLAPSRALHVCAFGLHVIAFQLADGCLASLASAASARGEQGRAQGMLQAATAAARICSPLVCARLFSASLAIDSAGPWRPCANGAMPFIFAGAGAMLCAALVR